MKSIKTKIELIGINPYVPVSEDVLSWLFIQAGKNKGPIPIRGIINGKPYIQTLVKYAGSWRLYINTTMLKDSPKRIGETVELTIEYDPVKRIMPVHPQLSKALDE